MFRFHFRPSRSSEVSAEPIKIVRRKSHLSFMQNTLNSSDVDFAARSPCLLVAAKILDQSQEAPQSETRQKCRSQTKHFFHLLKQQETNQKPKSTSRFFSSPNTSFLHRKTKSFVNDTTIEKILEPAVVDSAKKHRTATPANLSSALIKRRTQNSHRTAIQVLGREISSAQKPPSSDLSKRNKSLSSPIVKKHLPTRAVNTSYFKL